MQRVSHEDLNRFCLSAKGVVMIAHIGNWGRDSKDAKLVHNWTARGFIRFESEAIGKINPPRYSLASVIQVFALWNLQRGGTSLNASRFIADKILARAEHLADIKSNIDDEDAWDVMLCRYSNREAVNYPEISFVDPRRKIADLFGNIEAAGLSFERRIIPADELIARMVEFYNAVKSSDGTFADIYTK